MLDEAKRLEAELGRDPEGVRFGPRVIDCDLLLWDGGAYADDRLEIPHPRLPSAASRCCRCSTWTRAWRCPTGAAWPTWRPRWTRWSRGPIPVAEL